MKLSRTGLRLLVAFITASTALWHTHAAETARGNGVPPGRFALMTRGINVGWLNNKQCHLNRERAEQEMGVIKSADCRHVRLYLNIDSLRDPGARERPAAAGLAELDAALDLLLQNGLAVIVDPFHYGTEGLLKFPGQNDLEAQVMVDFWGALARHLVKHDPERVFLEVANEPGLDNPLEWYAVEAKILARMREGAPRHTLVAGYNMRASNHDWDGVKALTLFQPVADRNVVYNFHYYTPMTLTHQGAAWTSGATKILRDVPYPSSPEIIQPLLEKFSQPEAKRALNAYGNQNWNKQRILEDIGRVAEWAKRNNVLVTCNEFGVYRRVAPPSARANYTRDVREVLEHYEIGWTIWDSSFGFLTRQGGKTAADQDIVRALGLKE